MAQGLDDPDKGEEILTAGFRCAGSREKGGEPGGNPSTSSRRRPGEVDRFV
jgi:hypothetical protein